jgi:hypothetical protein
MEDENECEDEGGGFILSLNEKSEGYKLTSKKDYEKTIENQQEIISEFVRENISLFNKFLIKKGITEEEFNGETKK